MKMTNQEYSKYVDQRAPKSKLWVNILWAFGAGGLICAGGEGLRKLFLYLGMSDEMAGTSVSVSLIFIAALATALRLYDNIAKHAGAGTLVPITGFSNSVVSPAMEFKSEGLVAGLAAKMFTIAGPVLVFGICASVIYGLIYAWFV